MRQLELQTTIEQRRTVDEELVDPQGARGRGEAKARRTPRGNIAAEGAPGFARRSAVAPVVYDGIGEASLQSGRKGSGAGFHADRRTRGFRRSRSGARKGGGRVPARRTRVCGREGLGASGARNRLYALRYGRARNVPHPSAKRTKRSRKRSIASPAGEQGIVAKLSDVLRLTNGLSGAPADLLPRLSRCFIAEDRSAAQRLAFQYPDSYFLLPRWRLLSRSCG